MLFKFRSYRDGPFWMKNVLIDLDVLFLDSEGNIVDIEEMKPCRHSDSRKCKLYYSDEPYMYALEIAGGTAGEKGIKVGDRVEF
jgi:hypothetical protein